MHRQSTGLSTAQLDWEDLRRGDRGELEVARVVDGPPPTAPAQAKRFTVGPEGVPEPPGDVVAPHARNVDVKGLASQVRALERSASASLNQALLLIEAAAGRRDDEWDTSAACSIHKDYRQLCRLWRELGEMVRRGITG